MIKSISSKSSKDATFTFPDSVQSDLFNYLKPAQRKAIRPFLQIIKRPYQEKLCISLMDYLEGNGLNPISQPILRFLQQQIVEECSLQPLTRTASSWTSQAAKPSAKIQDSGFRSSSEPKSIGALIKQLFPSFSNRSNI